MRLRVSHQHSQFSLILARFMDYHSLFWVQKRYPWLSNPKVCLRVGREESQSGPILARFVDYYSLSCGPGVISTINKLNPGVRLCAGQQHSQFLSILPRFMAYYSLF